MVGTRRKSKAAAAAAAAAETSTRDNSPAEATLSIPVPDDIDHDILDGLLPGFSISSPSTEAIVSLYRLVVSQVSETEATRRDLEETRAEVERKDVELDQALQDRESATAELEAMLVSVQSELSQLKQEKDELAASRATLQAQVASLSTVQVSSSTEVDTLRHRVEDTEREKRDLVGVISRLREDGSQRDEEIQTLRTNLKTARHDYQEMERKFREAHSTETSNKFKIDSLTQQLDLAREEADRASKELATKSEEHTKYRRTKHTELAELQASHDTLLQTHASTESNLKALQSAHSTQAHQLTQALTRVQDLTGELANQEATYMSEVAGLKRLVDMMEARETQAKAIVESIEKEWAGVGERSERREAQLREEVEIQRLRAEEAEKRIDELQRVMDRVDRGEYPVPSTPGFGSPRTPARGPSTPSLNGTPDFLTQGMMGLSPTVAIASRSQRSGKTFTEVYADYVRLQEDYARKSAEYDHMDRTLSAVLAQIEERAPILSQQRIEYERVQSEAAQLASQLAQALSERDSFAAASEDSTQKFIRLSKENDLLQRQLQDLGSQVQDLSQRLHRAQDPSIPPDEEIAQDDSIQPAEDIDAVITNHLVLYRSIPHLQEQNQKLLRIVRELGAKMESEEQDYRAALEKEQTEAVREAHEAIKQLQEQLEGHKKSSETMIHAYVKERDTLQSMLARERAHHRTPSGTSGAVNGQSEHVVSQQDLAKELAEINGQFDAYRLEMGADSASLREEVMIAQREVNQANAAFAKAQAKVQYLEDRHRMVQDQAAMQNRELHNLTERNQQLNDKYLRADVECRRVTEDLLSLSKHFEQSRNECANLRAEKRIWESVQNRLVEENKALAVERTHLADLMANVQRMHGDLERSGENDRRRLESQIQLLESQTQDTRTQLNAERESLRHLTLQKDIEVKEHQTRIDKLAQEYAKTRESLVAAETSKTHLEERVQHLTRQLQGNEEKLAVYERRAGGTNGIAQRVDEDLPREQQLEAEVAELRSSLRVAEMDLASARSHVQQFQEISQANEMALATLNATHDEYKTSTEAELARHKSEYDALQERVQTLQHDLAQATEKYTELYQKFESERIAWAHDKKTLEDAIVDISSLEKNSETDRSSRESDIRQQEERAKAAEDRYSREVLSHAESIKTVEELKQQLLTVQAAARDHQAAAETAHAKLSASEGSWKQQKEALDKEIMDMQARCKDLASQNTLLHQHLESVSSQAARIRDAASASVSVSGGDADSADDADTKLSELRSVVTYLRREKDIVDLQLELSKQENSRQKAQIEHLSQNLEDTRKALSEERERAVEAAASEAQHAELVERINQLTILRESNATLRADCEAHARRARELNDKLKEVTAELDPVKEQLRIAQAELEAKDQAIKRAEEESQKWKGRNSQLLSKYDRVDPAEIQSLKDEIERLKAHDAELLSIIAERDSRIAAQIETLNEVKTQFSAKDEMARRQMINANGRVNQFRERADALTRERDELKAQLSKTTTSSSSDGSELKALQVEKASLEKALAEARNSTSAAADLQATIATLQRERDELKAEKASWIISSAAASVTTDASQWESEKAELTRAKEEASARAEAAKAELEATSKSLIDVRRANDNFKSTMQNMNKARATENERIGKEKEAAVAEAVAKLRSELQSAAPAGTSEEAASRHAEELRELEERLTKKYADDLKVATEAAKREALASSASAPSGDQQAMIDAAIAAHEEQMKEQREAEIAAAVDRGRMEAAAKGKLKDAQLVRVQSKLKEYETRIQTWQQAGLIPEEQGGAPAPSSSKPSAPTPGSSSAAVAPSTSAPGKGLPRKPSLPAGPSTDAGRGRGGRGGVRGLPAARGGPAGRGASRAGSSGTATSADAAPSGEMSIMGAAGGKRAREEEGDNSSDDALIKRIKQDGTSKAPIIIQRNRVAHPS